MKINVPEQDAQTVVNVANLVLNSVQIIQKQFGNSTAVSVGVYNAMLSIVASLCFSHDINSKTTPQQLAKIFSKDLDNTIKLAIKRIDEATPNAE